MHLLGSTPVVSLEEHNRVNNDVRLFNRAKSEYTTQPWISLLIAVRHPHSTPSINVKAVQISIHIDDRDKP